MFFRILLVLGFAVLSAGVVTAQPEPDSAWQVVLYDEIVTENILEGMGKVHANFAAAQVEYSMTRQLHFIGSDGLRQTVTLPPVFGEHDNSFFAYDVFLSPDLRYVVIGANTQTEQATASAIVDLTTMEVISTNGSTGFHSNFHGMQFASTYQYASYDMQTDETTFDIGLMTVDAPTGEVTAQMPLADIIEALDADFDFPVENIIVGSWQEDGVHFLPSCRNCYSYHLPTYGILGADIYAGAYFVWNPEDNSITRSDDYYLDFAETLPNTGEILQLGPEGGYQIPQEGSYGVPRRNTVRYWQDDDVVMDEGQVVYYGGGEADFAFAEWVLDGNAFLVSDPASGVTTLIFRGGTSQTVEALREGRLVGTPDGWLTISRNEGVYAYTVKDGTITDTEVMQFSETSDRAPRSTPIVAYVPDLGATAASETFPVVELPSATN